MTLNGTPTAAGTATFKVNVTDTAGATFTKDYTLAVNSVLAIAPPALADAAVGTATNQTITVSGGTTPYSTFNISGFNGGTTGLTEATNITVNAGAGTVVLSGTPTATGTASFTVNVIDTAGATLTKAYTLTVNPPGPTIAPPTLADAAAGTATNQTITVSGGTLPYTTFNISGFSGGTTGLTEAANLTLDATAGTVVLSGTPTAAGTASFTVNVTDTASATLTKSYTLTVNPAPGPTSTIYVGAGVTDNGGAASAGVATAFHCTNVSGVTAQVRLLVLNFNGTVAVDQRTLLPHARPRTFSTHDTALFGEIALSPGTVIEQGVVNIESDQSAVFCNAMIVNAAAAAPVGNPLRLTRVNPHPSTLDQETAANAEVNRVAPANVPFGQLRSIYVAHGVFDSGSATDTGAATSFLCTNVSGATAKLRYLVLREDGSVAANVTFDLAHGETHPVSTHATLGFREDAELSPGAVIASPGVALIESDQSSVFCTAMLLDASTVVPAGIPLQLTRVNPTPGTVN